MFTWVIVVQGDLNGVILKHPNMNDCVFIGGENRTCVSSSAGFSPFVHFGLGGPVQHRSHVLGTETR